MTVQEYLKQFSFDDIPTCLSIRIWFWHRVIIRDWQIQPFFDQTFGEDLAIARCSHKIAKKRAKRAKAEQAKAVKAVDAAMRKMQKMNKYVMDAENEVRMTADAINDLMKNV